MGQKQIQQALKIFTDRIKKKINPEQIILFGSYARGEANEFSDVDLIVISRKFAKIPEDKRFDILYDLTKGLYPDFHVYGFTKKELDSASPLTTLSQVKKYGIPLIS